MKSSSPLINEICHPSSQSSEAGPYSPTCVGEDSRVKVFRAAVLSVSKDESHRLMKRSLAPDTRKRESAEYARQTTRDACPGYLRFVFRVARSQTLIAELAVTSSSSEDRSASLLADCLPTDTFHVCKRIRSLIQQACIQTISPVSMFQHEKKQSSVQQYKFDPDVSTMSLIRPVCPDFSPPRVFLSSPFTQSQRRIFPAPVPTATRSAAFFDFFFLSQQSSPLTRNQPSYFAELVTGAAFPQLTHVSSAACFPVGENLTEQSNEQSSTGTLQLSLARRRPRRHVPDLKSAILRELRKIFSFVIKRSSDHDELTQKSKDAMISLRFLCDKSSWIFDNLQPTVIRKKYNQHAFNNYCVYILHLIWFSTPCSLSLPELLA
eukprot:752546-Hanusia_phi.AAC.5